MEPSLGGMSASPNIHLGWFFCHQYPELLVASYNNNEEAPHEPDGVALVWNMKYKKATPEYVFHCQVTLILPSFIIPPIPSSTRVAWSMTSMELCQRTPVCPPSLPCSHTPHPPAFIHIVSSVYWHPPPPHLSANTCSWGGGKDLWCTSWMESENCSGIKCVGRRWLSYASKQGSYVQTSKQGEQQSSSALSSLIMLPALRLPGQDKLSRTTCCCL